MHREALNEEILNASNFIIVLIVMAIVFFLIVHPYSGASSYSFCVSNLFTRLFCF